MIRRFSLSSSLLLFGVLQTLTSIHPATASTLNISHFIYPKIGDELRPQPSPFLEDVLNVISARQKWNLEDVRVSKLDARTARFGSSQRFEFRFRIGKSEFVFKIADEVSLWKKLKVGGEFESLVKEVNSVAVLDTFRVEGPFELQVAGGDELSLLLPRNISHTGLKRILVGEGITIEVKRAEEVSLLQASELGSQARRRAVIKRERNEYWSFWQSSCMSLLPIHISGSATVVAYRTRNHDAPVDATFLSREMVELLPAKCFTRYLYERSGFRIDSLSLKIALVEIFLRRYLGDRINQSAVSGFVKAKVKASNVVRFQLQLERRVKSNDSLHDTVADWRTRPATERVWFEVLARIAGERLKPLEIKKVRPFIGVDSSDWGNLLSNISFTKFPSLLVPQEALTLDVKW